MSATLDLPLPRFVQAQAEGAPYSLRERGEVWDGEGVKVELWPEGQGLRVLVSADVPLSRIHLRWPAQGDRGWALLGDAWERGYGDLEWRGLVPERVMPWYFLEAGPGGTFGRGVTTGARALCYWRRDAAGVSLWLDVRSGGRPVLLGERTLAAATVRFRTGVPGESPLEAARELCRVLCPAPRLPAQPVYGGNDWYYAYGQNTHEGILRDASRVAEWAPDGENRPFMVIDAGWQPRAGWGSEAAAGAPWDRGNDRFPDMPGLARGIRERGARPGIWVRPLAADPDTPASRLLPVERARDVSAKGPTLDPSLPENLERVAADLRLCRAWGYELIKHDWTTCDLLGRWGFDMGAEITDGGWGFADPSKTTAEVLLDLYDAIREGAGDALLIGCNTVGHLGAGIFELQRTGDDTSGREWERTRKMGVNTLAFRMPQHETFFAADADCVGLTNRVPWAMNRQWLDLLARSGTPLFVSASPDAVGPEQARALREAFALAARPQPPGEPLDWMETTCPITWRLGEEVVRYDWFGEVGVG